MEKKSRKPEETMNDSLLQDVALEMGIPIGTVKEVITNGQSKFTAHVMSNNEFNGVRWPYFGVFKAKHRAVQMLSYMKGLTEPQKKFFRRQLKMNNDEKYWKRGQEFKNNGKNKTD